MKDGDWWTAVTLRPVMDDNDCHLLRPDDPFLWSTDMTVLVRPVFRHGRRFPTGSRGKGLQYYMRTCLALRNVMAHSYGGQLAALAAGGSSSLVTVLTPYRQDLDAILVRPQV